MRFNTICTDCTVDKCADCFNAGKDGCDRCEKGLFFDGSNCKDCDDQADSVICSECSEFDVCTKCNEGYRLGLDTTDVAGKCLPCDTSFCAECDRKSGICS